jgi:hypothetical protein
MLHLPAQYQRNLILSKMKNLNENVARFHHLFDITALSFLDINKSFDFFFPKRNELFLNCSIAASINVKTLLIKIHRQIFL